MVVSYSLKIIITCALAIIKYSHSEVGYEFTIIIIICLVSGTEGDLLLKVHERLT